MNKKNFQKDLIDWYSANKRDLPWRENAHPYRVWVSEIMLQQTRVDTVIPYFNSFMEWFPTIQDFAYADEEQILKAWEGLGYYSRVRNLQKAARDIVENSRGEVPKTLPELLKLKGVGAYTAGAIASIAFGVPTPAVDGNVMRVYSRLFEIYDDIALPVTKKLFDERVTETISHADPSSFNQGIMELGALICTPKNPKCEQCPVQKHCLSVKNGTVLELPVKIKKIKKKEVHLISAIIRNEQNQVLIEKRSNNGLLAGLWQFPTVEVVHRDIQIEGVAETFMGDYIGVDLIHIQKLTELKHEFTHLTWKIAGFKASCVSNDVASSNQRWIDEAEVNDYAFPTSYLRLYEAYKMK